MFGHGTHARDREPHVAGRPIGVRGTGYRGCVFVKPPRPPKPPKPAVLPKPKLLDGESGVVVFAWLPGAPTPMGDLDGLGGATGSLLLSWVSMDDGKAVEVDIFENKPSR